MPKIQTSEMGRNGKNKAEKQVCFICPICSNPSVFGITANIEVVYYHPGTIYAEICASCYAGLGRFRKAAGGSRSKIYEIKPVITMSSDNKIIG